MAKLDLNTEIETTMHLEEILSPDRCFCRVSGVSKKRLLTKISELISDNTPQLESTWIFDALMAREQLGSTGLGNGIAIPHCRVPQCQEISASLITLDAPIDFDSVDNKPVDLLCVLLVPEEHTDEHVRVLAKLAELFSDEDFCYTLRHTQHGEDLYNIAIMH